MMKRNLMSLLLGASVIMASDAEAQRNRDRGNDRVVQQNGRVERLEPVRARGRVAPRVTYRARPGRVVYSSRHGYNWHRNRYWVNTRIDRFYFDRRFDRARRDRILRNKDLKDLLGNRTVKRVKEIGRDAGLRGPLRGYWVHERGIGRVLVVTMDRIDVAEYADFDGDGYIDEALLIAPDRFRRGARGW